jgi:hypothetical protein
MDLNVAAPASQHTVVPATGCRGAPGRRSARARSRRGGSIAGEDRTVVEAMRDLHTIGRMISRVLQLVVPLRRAAARSARSSCGLAKRCEGT